MSMGVVSNGNASLLTTAVNTSGSNAKMRNYKSLSLFISGLVANNNKVRHSAPSLTSSSTTSTLSQSVYSEFWDKNENSPGLFTKFKNRLSSPGGSISLPTPPSTASESSNLTGVSYNLASSIKSGKSPVQSVFSAKSENSPGPLTKLKNGLSGLRDSVSLPIPPLTTSKSSNSTGISFCPGRSIEKELSPVQSEFSDKKSNIENSRNLKNLSTPPPGGDTSKVSPQYVFNFVIEETVLRDPKLGGRVRHIPKSLNCYTDRSDSSDIPNAEDKKIFSAMMEENGNNLSKTVEKFNKFQSQDIEDRKTFSAMMKENNYDLSKTVEEFGKFQSQNIEDRKTFSAMMKENDYDLSKTVEEFGKFQSQDVEDRKIFSAMMKENDYNLSKTVEEFNKFQSQYTEQTNSIKYLKEIRELIGEPEKSIEITKNLSKNKNSFELKELVDYLKEIKKLEDTKTAKFNYILMLFENGITNDPEKLKQIIEKQKQTIKRLSNEKKLSFMPEVISEKNSGMVDKLELPDIHLAKKNVGQYLSTIVSAVRHFFGKTSVL